MGNLNSKEIYFMAENKPTSKKVASPTKTATKKAAPQKAANKKEEVKQPEATTGATAPATPAAPATAPQKAEAPAKAKKAPTTKTEAKEVKAEVKAEEVSEKVCEAPKKPKRTKGELAMLITSIVLMCLMAPILIVNVVLIISSAVHPNEMPAIFGVKPVVVISPSMEPEIKVNDLIFIKTGDYSNLQKGQVITFRDEHDAVVTHKIYAVGTNSNGDVCYRTYGVNNYVKNSDGTPVYNSQGKLVDDPDQNEGEVDKWITADKIEGIYQSRIGGLGGFILWMQGTVGIIVCIGVPLAAFIIYELIRRNNELKAVKATKQDSDAELEELRKKLAELEKNDKN